MAGSKIFRIPMPRTFLYLLSLRTGAELITLTLVINKVSGLYGILALLTGFHLSPPQFSMYIYSIVALVLAIYLASHVRDANKPLQVIALAWLYLIDSVINAAYTAAFAVSWFLVLARHNSSSTASGGIPGGKTIEDTAGFTGPEFNVSGVDVVGDAPNIELEGHAAAAAATTAGGVFSDTILESGSIASIIVISLLWAIRMYFIFIMFSYARGVLRRYIVSQSQATPFGEAATLAGSSKEGLAENPFAPHQPQGSGWSGKLGRTLVSVPRSFWLGADEDGEWSRAGVFMFGGRLAKSSAGGSSSSRRVPVNPTGERERRRRKGTGPPEPSSDVVAAAVGSQPGAVEMSVRK